MDMGMNFGEGFGGGCQRGALGNRFRGFNRFPGMRGFGFHGRGGRGCQAGGSAFASGAGPWSSSSSSSTAYADSDGNHSTSQTSENIDVDRIAKTLEEMGIKADGGVLRDLIVQFHGDIAKIIQAMS